MKKFYDNELLSSIKELIRAQKLDLAEEKIEDYKIMYPNDTIIYKYYAYVLNSKGLFKEAEAICLEALNCSFHVKRLKCDIYITLAESLTAQGKIDEAIDALEKAYNLKESNTHTIQIRLSNLYLRKNNNKKAIEILDKKERNDLNKNLEIQKAYIYISEKEYDIALQILLDINDIDLKNKKDIQRKNIYIGNIYKIKKDFEKALYYYSNVLVVKNEYYWYAYHEIGHIKYKMGFTNEAINILEETIKRYKDDLVLESLVKCYLSKGYTDKAHELIDDIKDDYLKQLLLGRIKYDNQDFNEAESIFAKLVDNNNGTRYYNYAQYYLIVAKFRLKKYDEALRLIELYKQDLSYSNRNKRELSLMYFYINKELGNELKPSNYSERQLVYYSEELAINHIRNHHDIDYTISRFNDNIDIEKLYHYIRKNIDIDKRKIFGLLDKYTIDFPKDMGNDDIRNLRSVSAICLPNTDEILTMYPDRYEQIIDVNEINESNNKPKVKRLSQIEKFNKRYNK